MAILKTLENGTWVPRIASIDKTPVTIIVNASSFDGNKQYIYSNSKITATSDVIVTYHPDSRQAYINANIYAKSQAAGSITFECVTAPTTDVKINILILN